MDKWRNSNQAVRRSSPMWNHPVVLLLILALCVLGLYWWLGLPEETAWIEEAVEVIEEAVEVIEEAVEVIEEIKVKGEKWIDALLMEQDSPQQRPGEESHTKQKLRVTQIDTTSEAGSVVRRSDKERDAREKRTPEDEAAVKDVWQSFHNNRFPRFVSQLQEILGVEDPIDIDWDSLGQETGVDERLEYDLEMLVRALGLTKRYQDPHKKLNAEQIRKGINRVHIRRVERMEQRRLEVEGDTLRLYYYGGRYGSFSSDEIRALLADRKRVQLSQWLNHPEAPLPPLMQEVRRNRLPLLYRNLETALGQPVPWHMDWQSLNAAPDATDRLVYMLDGLIQAIRKVLKKDSGFGMRPSVPERQRAEESRAIVLNNIKGLRVRGGGYATDPAIRFDEGILELVVFQDEQFVQPGESGPNKAKLYTEIRRYPPCRRAVLEKTIVASLDLEVIPYLRQAKGVYLPKAQAYVKEFFDTLIAKTRFKAQERVELREMLAGQEITLEIDWDSLTSLQETKDKMQILRKLETGKYNYNSNYGELFRDLFYAIGEATRQDRDFLKRFLSVVKVVRYEQVPDPKSKELIVEGSTLLLRQSLHKPNGVISYTDLAKKLAIAVTIMTDSRGRSQAQGGAIDSCLANLRQTVGKDVTVTLNDSLTTSPETAQEVCRRVVLPLSGAVQYLNKQPGYAALIQARLTSVQMQHSTLSEAPGISFIDGALLLRCSPEEGVRGCLFGDEMVRTIDDLLVLRVRAEISDIERKNRGYWHRMLRERFERDVVIEVDWDAFLSHPVAGGNGLYSLNVQQAGIERLIYALTRWMDDDKEFRAEVIQRISGLTITSAEDAASKGLELEGDRIVYHCFAGGWDGYYTIDELQQQLNRLIPRKNETIKKIEGWFEGIPTKKPVHGKLLLRQPVARKGPAISAMNRGGTSHQA